MNKKIVISTPHLLTGLIIIGILLLGGLAVILPRKRGK